jgi:hypothetical protein
MAGGTCRLCRKGFGKDVPQGIAECKESGLGMLGSGEILFGAFQTHLTE